MGWRGGGDAIVTLAFFAAALEAATGLVLIVSPSLAATLVFGADLSGPGLSLGRLAGIALLAFAVACWPASGGDKQHGPAARGLLTYNLLATVYFLFVGAAGRWVGPLLWPVVVLHAVLTTLIFRRWFLAKQTS